MEMVDNELYITDFPHNMCATTEPPTLALFAKEEARMLSSLKVSFEGKCTQEQLSIPKPSCSY